jgi:protein required for attachment to host cells
VRLLVADQGDAIFYDLTARGPLRLAGRLENQAAHLHDRDLTSDRPGRVFDRAPVAGRRRGAGARHATGERLSARRHAAESFARRISAELGRARGSGEFDNLVLVAGPSFLGTLRRVLAKRLRAAVILQIPKDLVHQPAAAVRAHLPRR